MAKRSKPEKIKYGKEQPKREIKAAPRGRKGKR